MTTTRVPQEERTRAMRARLLHATVDCLVDRGFAAALELWVAAHAAADHKITDITPEVLQAVESRILVVAA